MTSFVRDAIQTKDNEANHLIIYCLNCIRHGRNATYEPGVSAFVAIGQEELLLLLQDLFALDELSVPRYRYIAVIIPEVSVEDS